MQERQEDIDRQILKAMQNPPDEDEAFFISITPSVRKMSDEDKLDFRMNVLQLIKNINRRANNYPPAMNTPTSTSSSSTPYLYQPSAFDSFTQPTYHFDDHQPPLT